MTKPTSITQGAELDLAVDPAGKLLVIAPGLAHGVEAVAASAFLFTLVRGGHG